MTWKRAAEEERRACRVACGIVLLIAVVFLALCATARANELPERVRFVAEAGARCGVDPWLAVELMHVESLSGIVPAKFAGMTVAKACTESRGNPEALGDWRLMPNGKRRPRAVGLLQLWPWAERTTDRRDPVGSAYAYLGAMSGAMGRARRACPESRRDPLWLAWIRVNRGPTWRTYERFGEQRCHGSEPAGLRLLRRWLRRLVS